MHCTPAPVSVLYSIFVVLFGFCCITTMWFAQTGGVKPKKNITDFENKTKTVTCCGMGNANNTWPYMQIMTILIILFNFLRFLSF